VPINEQIVSECGKLIGAPVCPTTLIGIPDELADYEIATGFTLGNGLAHASRDIPNVVQGGQLDYRTKDANSTRHAAIFALYDWCWGGDAQWLFDATDDMRTFSHDHGYYFPGGPRWTVNDLQNAAQQPHVLQAPTSDLSREAVREVAVRLRAIDRVSILAALNSIPPEWPVTDAELEAAGLFLESRTDGAADRVLGLLGLN
jgi:hypothetical protein